MDETCKINRNKTKNNNNGKKRSYLDIFNKGEAGPS